MHGNRHCIGYKYKARGFDFISSYIYALLAMKAPVARFREFEGNITLDEILKLSDQYAFMFQIKMVGPHLKDDWQPMPVIQFSKCSNTINAVLDNGRILCAAYAETITNELDVVTILEQYDFARPPIICNVYYAPKDYLPRWFTDYVYELFVAKCRCKGGDPVAYSLAKSRLNSLYGLCVQRPVKVQIEEDYMTENIIRLIRKMIPIRTRKNCIRNGMRTATACFLIAGGSGAPASPCGTFSC